MFSKVFSGNITGIEAQLVCVEADITGGLPDFNMVGLLSSEIREAKERVIRACSNTGIEIPSRKITVNLSPAGIRKQGSGFDLPITVAILTALGLIPETAVNGRLFVGELSLDGNINPVNGILPIALMALNEGIHTIVVPKACAFEGASIEELQIAGVSTLGDLIHFLRQDTLPLQEHISLEEELARAYNDSPLDYADIKGQEAAKRATEVAVAGFHNLMYIGPPGSGKSMLARRIPTILSRLSREECLEISKIYSVVGELPSHSLVLSRPFRAPHHTISGPALVGGQSCPKPGEITLAHNGVLFLDEAAEFKTSVLQTLRAPLEDRQVTIARMGGTAVFPADFMLVMAMNPCRCGYYPDRQHCSCTEADVNRYFGKIKGPVLDRIDICAGTSRLDIRAFSQEKGMSSQDMREHVIQARNMQKQRFEGTAIRFNSQMSGRETEQFCKLKPSDRKILNQAYDRYNLSARGYYKILRVARTIADLDGQPEIQRTHIMEAISYRNSYNG